MMKRAHSRGERAAERRARSSGIAGLGAAMLMALLALASGAGCGGGGSVGTIPMVDGCVPRGFGTASFEVFCGVNAGGADRQCTFVFTSSNPAVLAISPSTATLQENTTMRINMTTIGNANGTSELWGVSDNGAPFKIGTIGVGC
jgi:hypothetical protein